MSTIRRSIDGWVQRYAPEIDKRCRPFLRRTNDSYRIDETYVRVAGAWTYLYRGVDSNGDTLDFLLRATRDRKAAIAFFRKTLGAAHTTPPRVVTVDKNPAYPVGGELLLSPQAVEIIKFGDPGSGR